MLDDNFTVSLLHMDGADASTTFADESGKSWTVSGNAQIDTAQSKFGGASGLFDGNADVIYYPGGGTDFVFGTGDFTVDFGIRPASVGNATLKFLYDHRSSSAGAFPAIYLGTDDKIYYNANSADRIVSATALSVNTWYHIAIVRYSGNTKLYLDGTNEGATYADATNYSVQSNRPAIGWGYDASNVNWSFNGWIDEVRVSKGIARWTANFTPPTQAYGIVKPTYIYYQ